MRDDGDDEGVSMVDDGGEVTLGVSVEDVQSVEAQMAGLQTGAGSGTVALVPKMDTLRVAQKVIGNAFDYLASFARGGQGEEVVPLKAFQEWWRKFEGRVQSDPGYLERA